jgi:general secretion pathway protein J
MKRSGFTLMEVLLALTVSAIVLAALGGVFFSAMRLRERTLAVLDTSAPVYQALGLLRRDLLGALPPSGGGLAGDFKLLSGGSTVGQGFGLQFSTSTGVINESQPWGDIQEVTWEIRDATVRSRLGGKELVRTVSRNLLTTSTLDLNDQIVLPNVESLEFSFLDGVDWRDSWDTSLSDTNLPVAVRVRVQLMADENVDTRNRQPIEMVFPLEIQSRTNQLSSAGGGQ